TARSRTDSFATPGVVASSATSSALRPTTTVPAIMPMVAGTAPCDRTVCSIRSATSTLRGLGSPWAISVLSRATTAPPPRRASATSSAIRRAFGGGGEGLDVAGGCDTIAVTLGCLRQWPGDDTADPRRHPHRGAHRVPGAGG